MADSGVAAEVASWAPALREEWEERAALVEDGCRVDRATAERLAADMLRPKRPPLQASLFERVLAKAGDS